MRQSTTDNGNERNEGRWEKENRPQKLRTRTFGTSAKYRHRITPPSPIGNTNPNAKRPSPSWYKFSGKESMKNKKSSVGLRVYGGEWKTG